MTSTKSQKATFRKVRSAIPGYSWQSEWRPVFGITIFAAGRVVLMLLRCLLVATACVAYLTATSLAMFSALTK